MAKKILLFLHVCTLMTAGCASSLAGDDGSTWPWASRADKLQAKQAALERCKWNLAELDRVAREANEEAKASAGTCPISGRPNEVVSTEIVNDPRPALRERITTLEADIRALQGQP